MLYEFSCQVRSQNQEDIMVNIQSIDEFKSIHDSEYGFVVIAYNGSKIIHKTKCEKVNLDEYMESRKPDSIIEFHWFSTVALAEKSFPELSGCKICNPD